MHHYECHTVIFLQQEARLSATSRSNKVILSGPELKPCFQILVAWFLIRKTKSLYKARASSLCKPGELAYLRWISTVVNAMQQLPRNLSGCAYSLHWKDQLCTITVIKNIYQWHVASCFPKFDWISPNYVRQNIWYHSLYSKKACLPFHSNVVFSITGWKFSADT